MLKRLGVLTILIVLALMTSVPAVSAYGQISNSGMILVDPHQLTPVQVPIPDISLPVVEPAQSAPATQAQGSPPPDRGQPQGQSLATGSIWIRLDGRKIHINFNARQIFDAKNPNAATGHINWREDGQTIRVSVYEMMFISNESEGWTCAAIGGVVNRGHETRENMCFMVCDDYETLVRWDFEFYLYENFSGNVKIKP